MLQSFVYSQQVKVILQFLIAGAIGTWSVLCVSSSSFAQQDERGWALPTNLSHSGTASSPANIVLPDGTLRIFWWDPFEGPMVADGRIRPADTGAWSAPRSAPIFVIEIPEAEELVVPAPAPAATPPEGVAVPVPTQGVTVVEAEVEPIITPVTTMPQIVGDANGRAHAFWLGEPDEETGLRALMYARLARGQTSWATPIELVEAALSLDVTTDALGALHLAYVIPVATERFPVGLYYRRSTNAGTSWSRPVLIHESRYLRLLAVETEPVRLTADGQDHLFATWDDPLSGPNVAVSTDAGATWQDPRPIAVSDEYPQQTQVAALPGRPEQLLWEPASEPGSLLAVSAADNALTLVQWDGARWSEAGHLPFDFADPESGDPLHLGELRLGFAPPEEGQGEAGETLVAVGTDQNGDVWITGIALAALERQMESAEDAAEAPANLSRGGAASAPAIVTAPDGSLRAFWWDQHDGLMVADGTLSSSLVLSSTEEIVVTNEIWSEPRPIPIPAQTMPRILADATGRIHAFWLAGEAGMGISGLVPPSIETTAEGTPDLASGIQALLLEQLLGGRATAPDTDTLWLMHTQMAADGAGWLLPTVLAESAVGFDIATDTSGALHAAYIDTVRAPHSLAGVYYRYLAQEDGAWTSPVVVHQSRYLRALSPEIARVRLAVEDTGGVYVTWDDPHRLGSVLTYSADGGRKWEPAKPVGDLDQITYGGRLFSVPEGEMQIQWETGGAFAGCSLYQAPASDVLAGSEYAAQQVLEGLTDCPVNDRFVPFGEGQILMIAGGGSDTLALATWDGEQWSLPVRSGFDFENPESDGHIYLDVLQATLVGRSTGSEDNSVSQALVVIGTDRTGDAWVTSSQMSVLPMLFAPPSPWTAPEAFSTGEAFPGLPAVAADAEGIAHVLWSEAEARGEPGQALLYARRDAQVEPAPGQDTWTLPSRVIEPAEGWMLEPALIAVGDELHAVWSGGQNGEVFYSRAFARDAYAASGWSQPTLLPAPARMGSWPHITADAGGSLHVVYAIPLNEQRGIYHTRSDDGGETWSPSHQVFDAAAAAWVVADYPRLAADEQDTLYAVWVRSPLPGTGPPEGVFYARSDDGGETWFEPSQIGLGGYAWPQTVTRGYGEVHAVWNEVAEPFSGWHTWSVDGGLTWTRPERVPGFRDLSPPMSLAADGSGALYLLGLGQDSEGQPNLYLSAWDGKRWLAQESLDLDLESLEPGVAASLAPALERLDVIFRGEGEAGDGATQVQLWHTGWQLGDRTVLPEPPAGPQAIPISPSTTTPEATSPAIVIEVEPPSTAEPEPSALPTVAPTVTPTAVSSPTPSFDATPPEPSGSSTPIPMPLLLAGGLAALIVVGVVFWRFVWWRRQR